MRVFKVYFSDDGKRPIIKRELSQEEIARYNGKKLYNGKKCLSLKPHYHARFMVIK